jgi:4-carboxymuconolactone decarboxylase
MKMPRIPYPETEHLSDAKRAYVDQLGPRMLNVVRMSLHTPHGLWEAQRDLAGGSVLKATIDPWLREILILRVAYLSRSDYELYHHLSIARNLGMSEATIAALESGDFTALTPEERAVAQFTTEVVEDITPTDTALAAVRALLPDALVFEMIALIGNYMMTARVIGVSGCELDGTALAGFERDKTLRD